MTIAGRFQAALDDASGSALAGPELLPVRLAHACVQVLGVSGAGLSLVDFRQERIPLGASSEVAEVAERLQFTAGSGPCTAAQEARQPVFADEGELHRRWPVFSGLLVEATPYRGIVALPLQPALTGVGAIDLYFERSADVPRLDVFEALAVGELVNSALSDAAVWSTWSAAEGPEWLHGPAPQRRAAVWEAMGTVSVDLEVDAPTALALLRARAHTDDRSVDDVVADLLSGRLTTAELDPGGEIA